jgi:NAD(P)-dependent dehydrogenase (short-subunit alcohol dehydrogenase family)
MTTATAPIILRPVRQGNERLVRLRRMNDVWRYDGRRTVVTGCASGIGEATAAELRSLGAVVVGVDRHQPSVDLDEFLEVDLSEREQVEAAAQRLDTVDALFNCAGLSNGAPDASRLMLVNFIALRHLTERVTATMGPGGAVVSIASLGGQGWEQNLETVLDFLATPGWDEAVAWCDAHPEQFERGAYGFSKQAVIIYTKLRCVELASRGIRINSIGPGVTQTPMLVDSIRALGGDESALDRVPAPLGRRSRPEEQARVLVFLNSDAASYVSGQNIWTDSGYMGARAVGALGAVDLRR